MSNQTNTSQGRVAAAAGKSAAAVKRKNAPKAQFSAEEKRKFAELKAAYRKRTSHFESFPASRVVAFNDNGRSKLVIADENGEPNPKEKACIELAALRTIIGSSMSKEGNLGVGENPPVRGDAKYSLGLALGHCDEAIKLRNAEEREAAAIDRDAREVARTARATARDEREKARGKTKTPQAIAADKAQASSDEAEQRADEEEEKADTLDAGLDQIAADQELTAARIIEASRQALGSWFDTNAAEEASPGYTAAIGQARASLMKDLGCKTTAELAAKEQNPANAAIKMQVLAAAREVFINEGKMPFGLALDKNGRPTAPSAWVTKKVCPMMAGVWKPGMPKDRPKGPSKTEIDSDTAVMPRLRKLMANLGHKYAEVVYENGGLPVGHPHRIMQPPKILVPNLDELGNPVVDAESGKPQMVTESDITWNPLFVAASGKSITSLVQCTAVLGLSNGGTKAKYGVTLTLFGSVVITAQAVIKRGSTYAYDDSVATGLLNEDAGLDDDEDAPAETDASASVNAGNANVAGLIGGTTAATSSTGTSTSTASIPEPPVAPEHDTAAGGKRQKK